MPGRQPTSPSWFPMPELGIERRCAHCGVVLVLCGRCSRSRRYCVSPWAAIVAQPRSGLRGADTSRVSDALTTPWCGRAVSAPRWSTSGSCNLAASTFESDVEHALELLLERGEELRRHHAERYADEAPNIPYSPSEGYDGQMNAEACVPWERDPFDSHPVRASAQGSEASAADIDVALTSWSRL